VPKKKTQALSTPVADIARAILVLHRQRVILDADLAALYGVSTKRLNEQVKRNAARFPEDFMFRLSAQETEALNRSHFATGSQKHRDPRFPPFAFTEHGAIMAATVLNSPEAVAMSVFVVRAFMQMREHLAANAAILKRLAEIDKTLLQHDSALRAIWTRLQPLLAPGPEPPRKRIKGFNPHDE